MGCSVLVNSDAFNTEEIEPRRVIVDDDDAGDNRNHNDCDTEELLHDFSLSEATLPMRLAVVTSLEYLRRMI